MPDDSSSHQFSLLASRRFLPLFMAQMLSAFNDNLLKNAMLVLVNYRLLTHSANIFSNYMGLSFIVPYFLFSPLAGMLADHMDKARMLRWVKFSELGICVIALLTLMIDSPYAFLLVLFLLGALLAFLGPAKYAILPQHLQTDELVSGNALVESSTFLAILAGTVVGGGFVILDYGRSLVGITGIVAALVGWLFSLYIQNAPSQNQRDSIDLNFFRLTKSILRHTSQSQPVFLAILGISWFWLIAIIFLTQTANFTKVYIQGSVHMVTFFLTLFSLGVGMGSLFCNALLKGRISTKYLPFALLLMSVFILDLVWAMHAYVHRGLMPVSVWEFMSHLDGCRIATDLFLVSVFGGIYTVPLYAYIQHQSEEHFRSRVLACNNLMNAAFMVLGLGVTTVIMWIGFTLPVVFALIGASSLAISLWLFWSRRSASS